MKLLKILIIMLIPMSFVYASQSYIKVTKTNSAKNFSTINDVLKEYKLNMKVMKVYNANETLSNIIYTGPFSTYEKAAYYQQKLKYHFENPQVVIFDRVDKTGGIYFSLGLGYGAVSSSYDKDNEVVKLKEPNNNGIYSMGELGYTFTNGVFTNIGYSTLKNNDLFFENIYISLGYRFYKKGDFVPYISVLGGLSSLTWQESPLSDASNVDVVNKSTSPVFGGKIGLLYEGFESFSLGVSYQLLLLDHTANIIIDTTDKSTYKHSALNTLLLEFQHKF